MGFVLAATIPGPAGPAPDLLRTLSAPVSRRRPRPAGQFEHFIAPGWPPGHAYLFHLEVPGGKCSTVTFTPVSSVNRASSRFHSRPRLEFEPPQSAVITISPAPG